MNISVKILLAATAAGLLSQGCSEETVKRSSFETLQNLHEQQCNRDLSGNCPPREGYEAYQRERNAALEGVGGNSTEAKASR